MSGCTTALKPRPSTLADETWVTKGQFMLRCSTHLINIAPKKWRNSNKKKSLNALISCCTPRNSQILPHNVIESCWRHHGDSFVWTYLLNIQLFVSNMIAVKVTETFSWSIGLKHRATLSFQSNGTYQMCRETDHKMALSDQRTCQINFPQREVLIEQFSSVKCQVSQVSRNKFTVKYTWKKNLIE